MNSGFKKLHPMVSQVTLKQLRAFVAAGRQGSFTRAGEQLSLSQPALTMIIKQLEETVGVTLFDRTTRRLTLTLDGEQFLPTAERLLGDFEFAIEDLHALADRRRSRIGIASVFSIATAVLPETVGAFAAHHPSISVHLRDDNSAGVCRRVRRNEVDFGFASRDDRDPELDYVHLLRDRMGAVACHNHPLMKRNKDLTWADLTAYEFLGLASDTGPWLAVASAEGIPEKIKNPRVQLSNIPTLSAMLESNLGVTALPALAFPTGGARGSLRYRPLSNPIAMRDVYLVTRKGRSISWAAQELKALILSRIAGLRGTNDLVEVSIQ